jgi:hypothetical protein
MNPQLASLRKLALATLRCLVFSAAAVAGFLCKLLLVAWCSLAIFFSNAPWPWLRVTLMVAFLALAVWLLCVRRGKRPLAWFSAACGAVVAWWSLIPPSHDRPWKPEVARMPRAVIEGDQLRISNFRNFTYRHRDDFDVRYEERVFDLADLKAVDFFISYWKPGPIGHTFLSFDFGDDDPLCISIEVRPEVGEGFAPVGSMFKQFELVYVAGDERDLVGVRSLHRNEDVYLYRTRASPRNARALLEHYVGRMNALADEPEFYHLLSNSCTVNIVRYARASVGVEKRFDIRYLLNGLIDQALYAEGYVDTTLPFAELRERSRINDEALSAEDVDFSASIRTGLPTIPNPPPP